MTETLDSAHVNEVNVDEIDDCYDDMTESGGGAHPPYVELSLHLVPLESAAEVRGRRDSMR